MFKKIAGEEKKETKTIDIITEEREHVCTEDCFKPRKRVKPRGLKKIFLGYIYQDNKGRFFQKLEDGKWLEVTGITFSIASGGAYLVFKPKEQLYIHGRGWKTTTLTTRKRASEADYDYYSTEAAKKLKGRGLNLRESLDKISAKVKEEIPKAVRSKKPVKGTGHGAPGIPRTPLSEKIVKLINEGKSWAEVLESTMKWAESNSMNIAGPHKHKIRRQVTRWWNKIKSDHK